MKVKPIPPLCLKGSVCEFGKRIMLSFCWLVHWKRQAEIPSSKENPQTLLHVRSADSKSSEKKLSWWLLSTFRPYRKRDENGLLIITLWAFSERWLSHLKGADYSLSFHQYWDTIWQLELDIIHNKKKWYLDVGNWTHFDKIHIKMVDTLDKLFEEWMVGWILICYRYTM